MKQKVVEIIPNIRIIKIDDEIEKDFFCETEEQAESFIKFRPDKYKRPEDKKEIEDVKIEDVPVKRQYNKRQK